MDNTFIKEKLLEMRKKTKAKRDKMKKQIVSKSCSKVSNENFKELEYIVYSTIK